MNHTAILLIFVVHSGLCMAGSFPGNDSITSNAPTLWADSATVTRGPVDITVTDSVLTTYGSHEDATGPSDAAEDVQSGVVSLGDGGIATLIFAVPLADGLGADLAVFENGFNSSFLELAHVEVSSDGINFIRFPSISQTQTSTQIGAFSIGMIDPTNLHNLAGKYAAGLGTPFDLAELRGVSPHLDVSHITHVRVLDAVGSINPLYGTTDSLGNLINDPFKTNFDTGGFDLDAVGAMYAGPTTPETWTAFHFTTTTLDQDEGDPDGDQIPNLLEYALASDPLHWNPSPFRLSGIPANPTIHWSRSRYRAGVNLSLEASHDVSNWVTLTESSGTGPTMASIPGIVVTESSNGSQVSAGIATGHSFFRLRAER